MARASKLIVLATLLVPSLTLAESAHAAKAAGPTPEAVLKDLKDGNARFVAGKSTHPHATAVRLKELVTGQHPEAVILGCADSRVPPEILFDEGLGDLFVVRVAGNIADPYSLGSVEYAAEHLGVPVVVVLGHHSCGAVKATAEAKGPVEGNIGVLVKEIQPAVAEAKAHPGKEGLVDTAVHQNVKNAMAALTERSPVMKKLVAEGKVKIAGAVYDLATGTIEWL